MSSEREIAVLPRTKTDKTDEICIYSGDKVHDSAPGFMVYGHIVKLHRNASNIPKDLPQKTHLVFAFHSAF